MARRFASLSRQLTGGVGKRPSKEVRFVGRARLFDPAAVRRWMKAHPEVGQKKRPR
jgi:hypothetical protein